MGKLEEDDVTSNWMDEVKRKKVAHEQIHLPRDASSPVPGVLTQILAPACRAREVYFDELMIRKQT
jgi:hypothetical protein